MIVVIKMFVSCEGPVSIDQTFSNKYNKQQTTSFHAVEIMRASSSKSSKSTDENLESLSLIGLDVDVNNSRQNIDGQKTISFNSQLSKEIQGCI